MKNIIKIACIAIAFLATSCNESEFLKEVPKDFFSSNNSFITAQNFEAATVDLYAQLRDYRYSGEGDMHGTHQYGTDIMFDSRRSSSNPKFGNYSVTLNPTSSTPLWHWTKLYKIVASANSILDRMGVSELTEDQKKLYEAEARYFRATAYRFLVHLFGGVPLLVHEVTSPQTDYVRASRDEIMAQILEDARFAAQNLPPIDQVVDGRLNTLAAHHLLAETYVVLEQWDDAIAAASVVIDDPNTALMTERFGSLASQEGDVYYDLFRRYNQNRSSGNTEAIWVAQIEADVPGGYLKSNERSNHLFERVHVPATWTVQDPDGKVAILNRRSDLNSGGFGVSFMQPTKFFENTLWESDFENDIRNSPMNYVRDLIYDDPTSNWYGMSAVEHPGPNLLAQSWRWYPWLSKATTPGQHPEEQFLEPGGELIGGGSTYRDSYYLRLAETYLLRAEAYLGKNDLTNAARDINVVRERAHATPVSPSDVDIDYILDERARELSLEEDRRIVLLRTGKLLERVRKYNEFNADDIQDFHVLWPIPANEIEANNTGDLEQNPGY